MLCAPLLCDAASAPRGIGASIPDEGEVINPKQKRTREQKRRNKKHLLLRCRIFTSFIINFPLLLTSP
jgi:hypothetical protein